MFFESVIGGLGTLANWQTYAAALMFLLLSLSPMFLIGWLMMHSGKAGGAVGCLSVLAVPFFQTFALVIFVLTLSPVMLGISDSAAWSTPWLMTSAQPWLVAKSIGVLFIATLVFGFIPVFGRFQSLHILLLGSFVLAFVAVIIEQNNPQVAAKNVHMWPGFWFVIGLAAIGSAFAWLGTLITAVMSTVIDSRFEGLGQFMTAPLAATLGFIPLFMYAAWIGAQIRG